MEIFRLEEKESFRVIGYRMSTTNQNKAGRKDIPKFWEEMRSKLPTQLLPKMNQQPLGLFGISISNTDEKDNRIFDYVIGVASNEPCEEGMIEVQVAKTLWAIFPCTRETYGKTEAMAIMKHLPKAGYKPLNKGYITGRMKSKAFDIECYGNDEKMEVWIGVHPK